MRVNKLLLASLLAFTASTAALAADAPIFKAVQNNSVQSIKKQLNAGQNPNIVNMQGHSPFILAIREGNLEAANLIAKSPKFNVNHENSFGETPLMYAAISGNMELAHYLIKRGAKINKFGWTPLHYAASTGKSDMAQLLLSKGAIPNAPAPNGASPLIMAVKASNIQTVKVLLEAGADPKAIDQSRKSALDYAKEKNLKSIYELMLQYDPRKGIKPQK